VLICAFAGDPKAERVVDAATERTTIHRLAIELLQEADPGAVGKPPADVVRKLELRPLPVTEPISFSAVASIRKHAPWVTACN